MFDLRPEIQSELTVMRSRGAKPSQLLRYIIKCKPELHSHTHELMFYLHETFHVPFSDLTCLQHWRYDGLGELDDAKIDMLIEEGFAKAILK